jgi:DNA primase
VAKSIGSLREENQRRAGRGVEFRIVRLPAGQDPADVVQGEGADAMRALLEGAVPVARFEVERALDRGGDRDAVLGEVAAMIAPLPPSVLREELVRLTASRLGLGEALVAEVLARPREPVGGRAGGAGGGGRDGGGRDRGWTPGGSRERDRTWRPAGAGRAGSGRNWSGRPDRWRDRDQRGGSSRGPGSGRAWDVGPGAEWEAEDGGPDGAHTALERREQSERAFLALCLALPDEGERRLAAADLEDLFAAPATRRVAAYLRGRLRAPAGALPAGDEALARLVAELVIRAGRMEATPAKLELEGLQLELHRLERHIASARLSGTEGVGALAVERQRVLDEIRHRLT